jgi:hypothetical protein
MAKHEGGLTEHAVELIVSREKRPQVEVAAGQKLSVVAVSFRGPVENIAATIGATLCGGTSTCIALIHTGEVGDPAP